MGIIAIDPYLDVTLATTSDWETVDLDDYIAGLPASTTGVILRFYASGLTRAIGFRMYGSTDARIQRIRGDHYADAMIGVDGNKQFQVYIGGADILVEIIGYTTIGTAFLTNGVDKSVDVTRSWETVENAEASGALGVIYEVVTTTEYARSVGFRVPGSSVALTNQVYAHETPLAVCECDESANVEHYISASTVDIYLIGYITSGVTFYDYTDYSVGSTGSYVDMIAVPEGGAAFFVGVYASTDSEIYLGIRANSSEEDPYKYRNGWSTIFSKVDVSGLAECKIANLNADVYLVMTCDKVRTNLKSGLPLIGSSGII